MVLKLFLFVLQASQPHVVTTQNSAKTSNMSGEAGVKPPTEVSKPKLPSSGQTTYVNPESTPEALLKKQAEMKRVCKEIIDWNLFLIVVHDKLIN